MNNTVRLLLMIILGPCTLITICVIYLGPLSFPVYAAVAVLRVIDTILGSLTMVPPVLSYVIMGFAIGAVLYFIWWESYRLANPRLRMFWIIFLCCIVVAIPTIWPMIDMRIGAPVLISTDLSGNKAGDISVIGGMEFVWIPPGRFRMGSPLDERYRSADEDTTLVALTHGFWLGKYEVTQSQWEEIMENNPSQTTTNCEQCPVQNVTWQDCQQFAQTLSQRHQRKFRLPTEAEWEYACRAGTTAMFNFGEAVNELPNHAWYIENSKMTIHPVGAKPANPWGLYDMYGNVWEWCQNWYYRYPPGRQTDPAGPQTGTNHVLRGGGWNSPLEDCRSAKRHLFIEGYGTPVNDLGLRLVCEQ